MPRKRHTAEGIVAKLRQVDVPIGQRRPVAGAVRAIGVSEVMELRDELLDGEIFYTLKEAQTVIEGWRCHYNKIRPHSSLGYRSPAPEATLWPAAQPRPASPATPTMAPRPRLH